MIPATWCSRDDWKKLSDLVCGIPEDPKNAAKLQTAISILRCLMSRLPSPPIGAQMTSELLEVFLAVSSEQDDTIQDKRPSMAFATIRFINYVSHALQRPGTLVVQPLHKMAAQLSVPDWLVTLRHDAAHGALPPPYLLRCAISAALDWVIAVYWREQMPDDETDATLSVVASLQQLQTMLNGARGRHVDRTLLSTCLGLDTMRTPALRVIAEALVTSIPHDGALSAQLLQSWIPTLSVVCQGSLLTELLEQLLTCASSERLQEHATAWLVAIAHAAQQTASSAPQVNGTAPDRRAGDTTWRVLGNVTALSGNVRWSQLVDAALRHKHKSSSVILPVLLDGMMPHLPERRRQLLLHLVDIATGRQSPPARSPTKINRAHLHKLGIVPAAAAQTDGAVSAPCLVETAAVASPVDDAATVWSRCTDGTLWRAATQVGRLPLQQRLPALLDLPDSFGGYDGMSQLVS